MRIGIEAKWYFRGPPSGRRVVRNLVRALHELAGDDELHLFLDARSRHEPLQVDVPADRRHYVWAGNNQLSNVFLVPRLADRLRLDAVVYQNFAPPRHLARHARIAFVHDVIFDDEPRFFTLAERIYFTPLRTLTRGADRVCTVSASERERLVRRRYAARSSIDVVPHGIEDTFVPRERLPAGDVERVLRSLDVRRPFVLYVGRLTARKNVSALVRAFALVRSAWLDLVLVGPADATCEDLHGLAATLGVGDRVRFLGPRDGEELRVLYAAAEVFCFPSLDESFGLPPLEAMAAGTPAIVSDVPAVVEVCGGAAIHVDPRDHAALAASIDAVVGDAGRASALRRAGVRRARSFRWSASAEGLLASVHAAVAGRP